MIESKKPKKQKIYILEHLPIGWENNGAIISDQSELKNMHFHIVTKSIREIT